MTSNDIIQWIRHPEMLNTATLYELRTMVARYPAFQSLR
ncbi:MAG: tetratricopeptide repeat protein, partial [Bacteroidales bacterium]